MIKISQIFKSSWEKFQKFRKFWRFLTFIVLILERKNWIWWKVPKVPEIPGVDFENSIINFYKKFQKFRKFSRFWKFLVLIFKRRNIEKNFLKFQCSWAKSENNKKNYWEEVPGVDFERKEEEKFERNTSSTHFLFHLISYAGELLTSVHCYHKNCNCKSWSIVFTVEASELELIKSGIII